VFVATVAALCACARPSWMRLPDVHMPAMPHVSMPSVTLPSLSGNGAKRVRTGEAEVVESPEVADFYTRASEFYKRLEGRRFNSVVSFRDAGLRAYFENEQSFTDYYAVVADDLASAHFERSVPVRTSVDEFLVDGPGRARVQVRIVGEDERPFRFWTSTVRREDRWERRSGQWWVTPIAP
jgi:hypothetical protein